MEPECSSSVLQVVPSSKFHLLTQLQSSSWEKEHKPGSLPAALGNPINMATHAIPHVQPWPLAHVWKLLLPTSWTEAGVS